LARLDLKAVMGDSENTTHAPLRTALTVNGTVTTALVGVGFSMVGYTPPEFAYARYSFIIAAVLIGVGGAAWLTLSEMTFPWRVFWGAVLGLAVFVAFPMMMRWVSNRPC
jgi:hypothetical protein